MYHTESSAVLLPSTSMASDMGEMERRQPLANELAVNRIAINASAEHSVVDMSVVSIGCEDESALANKSFYIGEEGSDGGDQSLVHGEKMENEELVAGVSGHNININNNNNNNNISQVVTVDEVVEGSGAKECSKEESMFHQILNEAKNKLLNFCPEPTFSGLGYDMKKSYKKARLTETESNAHMLLHVDTGMGMAGSFNSQEDFLNTPMTPLRNDLSELKKSKSKPRCCYVSPFVMEMLFSTIGILLSSLGNFAAGLILDYQQRFTVYHQVPELIYLVPTLLGLKGNLEMTMVARLCTMANMGQLRSFKAVSKVMLNNVCMVQSQAILVSFIASGATLLTAGIEKMLSESMVSTAAEKVVAEAPQPDLFVKFMVVLTTSLWTSNIACLASSIFLILLIVGVSRLGLNPDNFATALAASIGDMITSFLIGILGQFVYAMTILDPSQHIVDDVINVHGDHYSYTLVYGSIAFFVAVFFVSGFIAFRDQACRKVLLGVSAWTPIFISMLLSFLSGKILRSGMASYRYIALFQPLLNGVGGNLAAISASRLSTLLHQAGDMSRNGRPRMSFLSMFKDTCHSFVRPNFTENSSATFFLVLSLGVQLLFALLLPLTSQDEECTQDITVLFYVLYLIAATIQVIVLLVMVRYVVNIIWWFRKDPDTCAIPILTAVGDLFGSILLLGVFIICYYLNDSSAAGVTETEVMQAEVNGQLAQLLKTTFATMAPTTTTTTAAAAAMAASVL